jgi:hypothetical protein
VYNNITMDDFINKKINGAKYITRLMYNNITTEAIELNQTKENVDNFLQNNNIKVNNSILLMYIDGETNTEKLLEHWEKMNDSFIHKDDFYIVIHPKTLIEKYKINDTFKNIFHEQNIFIVDEDHHLLTRCAKHSLSYATFMMMQYANIQYNNNFFDKYILLTSSCLPLYTLDEIYNELSIYNKSWINGKWVDTQFKFIFSEWAILDKQHAIYFFYNNIFK